MDPLAVIERALSQLTEGGQLYVKPTGIDTSGEDAKEIVASLWRAGYDLGTGWEERVKNVYSLSNFLHIIKKSDVMGHPIFSTIEYDASGHKYWVVLNDSCCETYVGIGYRAIKGVEL